MIDAGSSSRLRVFRGKREDPEAFRKRQRAFKFQHLKAFRRFSLKSRGFPASARMRAKSRFWKELRKERKELHSKGNTQAGSNTDKSILRCIAMNNINWGKVPDELTMEQFYKLCHVSKKTARYLLRSGKIPCKYTGKRTHS